MNTEKTEQFISNSLESTDLPVKEKLAYQKPELINYGKVSNLTKGSGSQFFDEGAQTPFF